MAGGKAGKKGSAAARPTLDALSQRDTYKVQELLGHRRNKGHDEWLVHWKGWGRAKATWEPTCNLAGFEPEMEALKKRLLKLGKKRSRPDEEEVDEEEEDGLTESPGPAAEQLTVPMFLACCLFFWCDGDGLMLRCRAAHRRKSAARTRRRDPRYGGCL